MMQLNEFVKLVDESNIDESLKSALKYAAEPSFNFRQFLVDKLNIDEVQAEALVEARVASKAEGINETLKGLDLDNYIEAATVMTSDVVCDFAREQGYPDINLLGESLVELLKFNINQKLADVARSN